MFTFIHRGIVASLPFDATKIESEGVNGTYGKTLTAGAPVSLGANGLQAGVPTGAKFLGFLVEGIQDNVYQNASGLASGLLAVTIGNVVGKTDAVTEGVVFESGDQVYVDATSKMLTNVDTGNGSAIGIAIHATDASNPAVSVAVA